MAQRRRTQHVRSVNRRNGITLFELVLVLALLIVIGAMALPALHGSFNRQILRKSGEQIRVDLAKTRNEAMRTGRILVFQYELGTGNYMTRPWSQESDLIEGNLALLAAVGGSGVNSDGTQSTGAPLPSSQIMVDPFVQNQTLPEKVIFAGSSIYHDIRSQQLEESGETTTQMQNSIGLQTQMPPIVFYPDGTTSDAQIFLRNDRNHVIIVQLRGLTGMSRITDPLPNGTTPQLQVSPQGSMQ